MLFIIIVVVVGWIGRRKKKSEGKDACILGHKNETNSKKESDTTIMQRKPEKLCIT